MIVPFRSQPPSTVFYPESDGKPMAENTLQAEWIVRIMGNLDLQYRDDPNVFVAMDNFIYAVEGDNSIVTAPDVYVAFGRPKGHRGSYQVWVEDDIFPQVIFEILSPSNTRNEMLEKREFYFRYGAEEFYIYDPERNNLEGYLRKKRRVTAITNWENFVSPRLGIRLEWTDAELHVIGANGQRFLTFLELGERAENADNRADTEARRAKKESRRAEQADKRAEQEVQRAVQANKRADNAEQKLAQLRAKLLAAGLDPDANGQ